MPAERNKSPGVDTQQEIRALSVSVEPDVFEPIPLKAVFDEANERLRLAEIHRLHANLNHCYAQIERLQAKIDVLTEDREQLLLEISRLKAGR